MRATGEVPRPSRLAAKIEKFAPVVPSETRTRSSETFLRAAIVSRSGPAPSAPGGPSASEGELVSTPSAEKSSRVSAGTFDQPSGRGAFPCIPFAQAMYSFRTNMFPSVDFLALVELRPLHGVLRDEAIELDLLAPALLFLGAQDEVVLGAREELPLEDSSPRQVDEHLLVHERFQEQHASLLRLGPGA